MNETSESKNAKKKPSTTGESPGPVHVIRQGAIAASIWKRQTSTGYAYYEFTLSRSWKSVSSERTGYSSNFSSRNEKALLEVVPAACAWIAANSQNDQTENAQESLAA